MIVHFPNHSTLTFAIKALQGCAEYDSHLPSGSLESRTAILPLAAATSTQSPLFMLRVAFRQASWPGPIWVCDKIGLLTLYTALMFYEADCAVSWSPVVRQIRHYPVGENVGLLYRVLILAISSIDSCGLNETVRKCLNTCRYLSTSCGRST